MTRMTPEQQQFATEHHKLIYQFLRDYGLDIGEWYDIVAIGLIEAVAAHDYTKGYRFATLAYLCMKRQMYKRFRYQKRSKRQGIVVSLSEPLREGGEGEEITLGGTIAAPGDFTENVIANVDTQNLLVGLRPCLTGRQWEIFQYRLAGYSNSEIAGMTRLSKSTVRNTLCAARKKIRACLAAQTAGGQAQ